MPTEVEILDGFIDLNEEGLKVFLKNNGLAMTANTRIENHRCFP